MYRVCFPVQKKRNTKNSRYTHRYILEKTKSEKEIQRQKIYIKWGTIIQSGFPFQIVNNNYVTGRRDFGWRWT